MSLSIGVTDYVKPPFGPEQDVFGADADLVFLGWESGVVRDLEIVRGLDALLVWHATIDEEVVDAAERCQVVVRYGVGVDNIDLEALERRGIVVCNTPAYGVEEVADTTLALILSLHRGIFQYDEASRWYESGWQEHVFETSTRTSDTTVGVIGLGRIGSSVVLRLNAIGYRVVGFDPYVPAGTEKVLGCSRADSLEELCREADIVTLHCTLTRETKGMVDSAFFAGMRPNAILVNTARGGLLSSLGDLEQALKYGQLAAAGLDVLPEEPPPECSLIRDWRCRARWLRGRLILTPHTAFHSSGAWEEMRRSAAETALQVLSGGLVRHRVRHALVEHSGLEGLGDFDHSVAQVGAHQSHYGVDRLSGGSLQQG